MDKQKQGGRALANRCYLCEDEEETVEHLLLHFYQARML